MFPLHLSYCNAHNNLNYSFDNAKVVIETKQSVKFKILVKDLSTIFVRKRIQRIV